MCDVHEQSRSERAVKNDLARCQEGVSATATEDQTQEGGERKSRPNLDMQTGKMLQKQTVVQRIHDLHRL